MGVFRRQAVSRPLAGAGWVAAAALAVTALLVRRSAKAAEREHPPAGQFVEVDGVRLHYREQGSGPPVVLLHGVGLLSEDFAASGVLDALATRHRVIAFDRPGFGFSERPRRRAWTANAQADLLKAAFAALDIQRPVVVGHSWGTLVAVALALRHPDDVRGLVLLSGYYYPKPRLDRVFFAPPAIPLLGDLLRYTVSPLLGRLMANSLIRAMFAPCPVPAQFFTEVPRGLMLRPWQIRAGAEEAALLNWSARTLTKHYGELQLPVAILAGTEDRVVPIDQQSARLHQELPDSRFQAIPGVGHMIHYAVPEQVAAAVEAVDAAR